jgi:3-hydroxyisobutyrate dehydrogenase-like beta-hydroxyacid dehydrogenase
MAPSDSAAALPPLGFIGLGAMGGAMVRTLLAAGCTVLGYDINEERLAQAAAAGVESAESGADVARRRDVVLTSLRSSAIWAQVAEADLVPNARPGQVFIDLGTVAPPETRRLAEMFAEKGATLLDVPVSGGPGGSASGTLHMFAGGDRAAFDKHRPLLEVLGEPRHVVYCGPSGCGQVVKAVNQLAMGLADAGYLEALALGVRAGADIEAIRDGVGGDAGWRGHFAHVVQRVIDGNGEGMWIKFPEFPYFLAEAHEKGIPMPITEALQSFCSAGDVAYHDNMNRLTASFWHELMTRESERVPSNGPVLRVGEEDE